MKFRRSFKFMVATAALAIVAGAGESRADSCSASASLIISRSTGGTCGSAAAIDDIITLTYNMTNLSEIDDPLSVNDGDAVTAVIPPGERIDVTLAQETSGVGGTQLPGVLEFVPVCSADSSLNAGNECDPGAPNCGTGHCGCSTRQPGVTCVADGANGVNINFGSNVDFNGGEEIAIASIRTRVIGTVDSATCGQFFTRGDSDGDILETNDADCDADVTAGAQASANLHAPECLVDADCGDVCQVCADVGTDPHCEAANEGSECDDDGVDCTTDLCDAEGNCVHTEDDSFCDDANECTTEVCDAQNDCVYDFICETEAICRSPGYWATHSSTGKEGSINVGQLVIDTVGPLEVCGQSISETDDLGSLDASLEGLCMRSKGVTQRQLYRQLVAAALNCAISGDDCDAVTDPFMGDVTFSDCSDLCAGDGSEEGPTEGECIAALDCFNNGGTMYEDGCAFGNCESDNELCGGAYGECADEQECIDFPANCHSATLCNEELGICPKKTPASSAKCREARGNDCTIDSCD